MPQLCVYRYTEQLEGDTQSDTSPSHSPPHHQYRRKRQREKERNHHTSIFEADPLRIARMTTDCMAFGVTTTHRIVRLTTDPVGPNVSSPTTT